MAIDFEYVLEQYGWAKFAIVDGDRRISGESGNLRNPIADLATWAVRWSTGFGIAHIGFAFEPGSYVCRMWRDGTKVNLECRCVDGMWELEKLFSEVSLVGEPLFRAVEDHRVFAVNVCLLLDRLWRTYGVAGYIALDQPLPFPITELLLLRIMHDRNSLAQIIVDRTESGEGSADLELQLLCAKPDLRVDGLIRLMPNRDAVRRG